MGKEITFEDIFGDEKTHNKLVIALQLLNQINKQLTDVMHTGKLAAIQTDCI